MTEEKTLMRGRVISQLQEMGRKLGRLGHLARVRSIKGQTFWDPSKREKEVSGGSTERIKRIERNNTNGGGD